jgi:hypothetical protein
MIGFGVGGILMGRLADRFGVIVPGPDRRRRARPRLRRRGPCRSLWQFALAQGLLIGLLGMLATFAPLVADTSLWFTRRRGIAVAICASGNYLAGAVWPPTLQHSSTPSAGAPPSPARRSSAPRPCCRSRFALRRKPPALEALERKPHRAQRAPSASRRTR